MYRANGVRCDLLKMGENGILSREIRRTPASVLHVTPYQSFPSGRSADASKRMEYIRWALDHDSYLVEDDYDSEFTLSIKAEQTLFSLEPESHVIYLNTFTRTIAPSIRISYMILPEKKTKEFLEKISFRSCTVSTLSQLVLADLINSGNFERHINRIRRRRRKEKSR
jgi:GntR family transcriptional regulator/MocR family aminotransferase